MPLGRRQRISNQRVLVNLLKTPLKNVQELKRVGNLLDKICSKENIELADAKARRNKKSRWGIIKHDKHKEEENQKLAESLANLTYVTSQYSTYKIYEPKERLIFRLPYYPDRITHHAIMNIMEPIWVNIFIKNTYSCIKNRGIRKLSDDIRKDMDNDPEGTAYCAKLNITKFYPLISHPILEEIIRKKIKDEKLLTLLHEIIESADGVPIGNYLSQFFANLYLTYFDHWVKEELKIKYYYRYADDIVILHSDKRFLHNVVCAIKLYLDKVLQLIIKPNYQVFPTTNGVDFVGYKFYPTHTLLRKSIKLRLKKLINKYKTRKISKEEFKRRFDAYFGWLKYCDSKHLLQKIKRETGIHYSNWNGKQINILRLLGKKLHIIEVVRHSKYFEIHHTYKGKSYTTRSSSNALMYSLSRYQKFPLDFVIHERYFSPTTYRKKNGTNKQETDSLQNES